MPIANKTEAADLIYGRVKAIIEGAYPTMAIYYPDVVKSSPNGVDPHVKVYVDHGDERQDTLNGAAGTARYCVSGLVIVQIFTPAGKGSVLADEVSGVVKGAFRGVNRNMNGIWFRRARAIDVGQDGSFLQVNVTAEFEYDEIA